MSFLNEKNGVSLSSIRKWILAKYPETTEKQKASFNSLTIKVRCQQHRKTRLVRLGFSWLGLSRLGLTWLGLAGWLGLTYPCLALTFLVLYPTRIHLAIGTTAWCVKTTGLDTGPRSAASTSSKILTIYARPTKTPHNATETHRIVRAMATQ